MEKEILIVVDDSSIITSFVSKLLGNSYNVMVAKDGNEAINLIRNNFNNNVAGMFLDLNMPDCNGFKVLDIFKENNLFKKIPVCILTGDDTKDSINEVFKYPIVDVLNKPFNKEEIEIVIEKMKLRNR